MPRSTCLRGACALLCLGRRLHQVPREDASRTPSLAHGRSLPTRTLHPMVALGSDGLVSSRSASGLPPSDPLSAEAFNQGAPLFTDGRRSGSAFPGDRGARVGGIGAVPAGPDRGGQMPAQRRVGTSHVGHGRPDGSCVTAAAARLILEGHESEPSGSIDKPSTTGRVVPSTLDFAEGGEARSQVRRSAEADR